MEESFVQDNPVQKQNRMSTEPEGRLLFSLAIPIVISMLVQALYNVVDSIFVSRISENALTAVSLAYPMQMLMISVAVGTGVGLNSLISRRLGARRFEEANLAAGNGLFLMLLSSVAFILFGLIGVRPFFRAYTDNAEIFNMGVSYLSICCTFCPGVFFAIAAERVMQAQGKAVWTMVIQLLGAVTNIVFDPIMIFGLLGFPALGIAGAAIATVLGQCVSMTLGFFVLFSRKNEVKITVRGFRPDKKSIRDIYKVGVPSIVLQSFSTVMSLTMNAIFIAFTETAVAVFGVYFKLQSLIFMPVFGITGAAMSILAFNYGARSRSRMMRTFRITIFSTISIMVLGSLLFYFFPDQLLLLFDASPDMLGIGRHALRVLGITFPIAAYCISNSVLFQAVGNGVYSMFMSFTRQMIALVPAALILKALTNSLSAVWWSFPIAEVVGLILTVALYFRLYREKIEPIKENAPDGVLPVPQREPASDGQLSA